MILERHDSRWLAALAFAALLLLAPAGQAADLITEGADVVEIDRDGLDFRRVAPRPTDPPLSYDTALVFSNTGRAGARVICKGFDDAGRPAGRAATFVPGLGLRYLLASDLTNGDVVLGQVQCATEGRVIGSAFLLGGKAGITEMPSRQGDHDGAIRIRFPVVFAH